MDNSNPGTGYISTPEPGDYYDVAAAVGAGHKPEAIIADLLAHPNNLPVRNGHIFDLNGALAAGLTPAAIVDELNPKADAINVQGIPVLAPLDRGIAHLRAGAANLATDLGAPGIGSAIRQSIPLSTLAAPTSGAALADDLGNRRYLSALSNLPSAVLEGAAPVAGAVVAGTASGGSIPAALATGAGIGALTQGDAIARQRAVSNGRDAPNAGDLALGIGGGAAVGAVGALGLGGTGGGIANAARATLLHTAADATQPELTSLAGSVGTGRGAQNAEPQDLAAAALTGFGTRGAMAVPALGKAAYEMTPGGRRGVLADQFNAMSPAEQANVANTAAAGKLLETTANDVVPGIGKPTDAAVARSAGSQLDRGIQAMVDHLDGNGLMAETGKDVIGEAWQAAADPRQPLLFRHLDALDGIGLTPEDATTLRRAIFQRSAIASAETDPQASTLGTLAGLGPRLVGRAVQAVVPSPVAMVANPVLRGLGEALGARLGFSDPALKIAGAKAAEMMMAAGQPIPDTYSGLTAAAAAQQNVVQAQARLMGLDPRTVVPSDEAAAVQATQPAPGTAEARAVARSAAKGVSSPDGTLLAPMPGMNGLNEAAKLHGQLLPEWQYGLGKNLMDALNVRGTPRNVNPAQEVNRAVQAMTARGWFPQDFTDALMAHRGRVVRGVYNTIRNEMLMAYGIDMRSLEAQQPASLSRD